jgi:hypothetical protein
VQPATPPLRHSNGHASDRDSSSDDALPSWDAAAATLPTPSFAAAAAAAAASEEGATPECGAGAGEPEDWSDEWEFLCLGGETWVSVAASWMHAHPLLRSGEIRCLCGCE